MAPQHKQAYAYEKDERVLCFHGAFLYEAKILDLEKLDPSDKKSPYRYFVHYKGWKNTWDDWVPEDRLKKFTDDNREFATNLQKEYKRAQNEEKQAKKHSVAATTKRKSTSGNALGDSELGNSLRPSEERSASVQAQAATRTGTKRSRGDIELQDEKVFNARPAIRIPLPDHLKGLLVDDWEYITKDLKLIPLPHPHPISSILADYFDNEAPKRRPGSAEADILEEVVQGIREYFDRSLGRILLYRFERQQWLEVHEQMEGRRGSRDNRAAQVGNNDSEEGPNLAGKTPSEVYGAEHLCRLFVSMPELIAQTNMDAQSVSRLREELAKITQWLGKNSGRYFIKQYRDAGTDYTEKAKGTG